MIEARFRRFSSMTPHYLMPHGIPDIRKGIRNRTVIHSNDRKPTNNPHSQATYKPEAFDEYISHVDVVPGNPIFVIAELRGVVPYEKFILQPAKTPKDPLIFAAKARIGLTQEGFVAVEADNNSLSIRVGDATGPLQEQRVEMPPYNPRELVVEYRKCLVIASVT